MYDSYYRLSSNFGVITYSYDTLTVIQSRTSVYVDTDDYYPKYLSVSLSFSGMYDSFIEFGRRRDW